MEENSSESGIFTGTLEDFLKTRKPGDEMLQSADKSANPMGNWYDCCEYQCKICNETHWSNLRFHWHITKKHGIKSTKDYRMVYGNPDILPRYHQCQLCKKRMVWEGTRIRDHLKRHAHPEKPTLEQYGEMFKDHILEKITTIKVKIEDMPEELRSELQSYAKNRSIPTLSIRKTAQEEFMEAFVAEEYPNIKEAMGKSAPSSEMDTCFVSVKSEIAETDSETSENTRDKSDLMSSWYDCCQFLCGLCQEACWSLKEFQMHIITEHDINDLEEYRAMLGDPEKNHQSHKCHQCKTLVRWEETALREHMKSHVLHRQMSLEEYGFLYKSLIFPKVLEIKGKLVQANSTTHIETQDKEQDPSIAMIKQEVAERQSNEIDIKEEGLPIENMIDNLPIKCEIEEESPNNSFTANDRNEVDRGTNDPNGAIENVTLNTFFENCTPDNITDFDMNCINQNMQTPEIDTGKTNFIQEPHNHTPSAQMTVNTDVTPVEPKLEVTPFITNGGIQPMAPDADMMPMENMFTEHFLSFSDENQMMRTNEEKRTEDMRNMPGGVFNSSETMEYFIDESEFVIKGTNFECQQCGYTISSKRRYMMKNHILAEHKGVRYKCNECNYEGKSREKLNAHMKRVHFGISANPYVVNDGMGLKCDKCDFRTNRGMYELNLHIQAEHDGIKHFCLKCSFSSKRKDLVQRHMKQKHLGIVFRCEQCSYTSSWKYSLQRHIAKSHGAESGIQKYDQNLEEDRSDYGNFSVDQNTDQTKINIEFEDQIKIENFELIDPCNFVATNLDPHPMF